jgi:glycosyltransferase involved in cell wall biosynthesis
MQSWPVGIDTENYNIERNATDNSVVMIYYKRRDPKLLYRAIDLVKNMGLIPQVIKYGEYNEDQYKQILSKSKFGVWIGVSESQGIGLQEALASGLPLIVCDVNSLFESSAKNEYKFPEKLRNFKPTSAPYFDERCGIIINDFSKLGKAANEMLKNISYYNPREYIIDNLSLEKQALELLSFFKLLEQEHGGYFKTTVSKKEKGKFKLSFHGNMIYMIFLIIRKTRTVLKILKNELFY